MYLTAHHAHVHACLHNVFVKCLGFIFSSRDRRSKKWELLNADQGKERGSTCDLVALRCAVWRSRHPQHCWRHPAWNWMMCWCLSCWALQWSHNASLSNGTSYHSAVNNCLTFINSWHSSVSPCNNTITLPPPPPPPQKKRRELNSSVNVSWQLSLTSHTHKKELNSSVNVTRQLSLTSHIHTQKAELISQC